MNKNVCFSLVVVLALFLASCSSKIGDLSAEYFTVSPQILEVSGGEVPVTINGKFPEKYFNKNAIITISPVLTWDGGSEKGDAATFQGENVQGNNQTISFKNGGNFTMRTTFSYLPEMEKSELYLNFAIQIKNKSVKLPAVKIADGVISTSQLYSKTAETASLALGEDAFQRVIKQVKEANIMFLIQQTNLRTSELNSAEMHSFNDALAEVAADAENKVLDNVEVSAYASPDGGVVLNDRLADGREINSTNYVRRQMNEVNLDGFVDSEYTAEDWEGFRELVSKSNLPDKELILRVLSMYEEPEEREAQIKNISSVYKDLADEILPQLRRSRLTLNYQLIGRSDDEILEILSTDAKSLSLEELLYAATLFEDESQILDTYKKITELHPGDYRAYNNLATISYKKGDLKSAENYLKTALKYNSNASEVNTNLGLLALCNGDVETAETYIAKGVNSKVSDEALGNLYIAQGQYARAETMFGETKSNSAALSQLLNKNYVKARTTLSSIAVPDAYTYYITALLGARTKSAALLYDGLRKAINLEPSLAQRASRDLEFAKFADSATFLDIVNK